AKVGNIWYGSDGYVVSVNYHSGTAFDRDGKQVAHFDGGSYGDHFANFVKAVRSRRYQDLNADIEQGHLSSALCHLCNVSYRRGRGQAFGSRPSQVAEGKRQEEAYVHFLEHLKQNGIPLETAQLRVGCEVTLDPKAESATRADCNKLFTREYRKG